MYREYVGRRMDAGTLPEPASPQIARTLNFLTALEAQLRDSPDIESMAVGKYGLLVPPGVITADAPPEFVSRLAKFAQERELIQALIIETAIRVLQELIERWEFTQSVPTRSLRYFDVPKPFLMEDDVKAELVSLGIRLEDVDEAFEIAREVHGKSTRDDGAPYLDEHIFPVSRYVAAYLSARPGAEPGDVLVGTVVALLHDSLEDCVSGTDDDVRRRIRAAYGQEVLAAVEILTKRPKEHYSGLSPEEAKSRREGEYMAAIRDAPYVVRLVKVFDRINNLECIHASPVPGKAHDYAEETRQYHLPLASQVDPALAGAMRQVIDHLVARD